MMVWSIGLRSPPYGHLGRDQFRLAAAWFSDLRGVRHIWRTTSPFSRTRSQDNYLAHNNLGAAYRAGQHNCFRHFKSGSPPPKFSVAHYNLGLSLRAQDKVVAAQREFEMAVQYATDPVELAQAHHNLGIALYEQQQFEAARKELSAALAIAPDKENSLLARGMTEFELKDYSAAGADFQRASAVRLTPQAIFWIGRTREATGDFNGAAAAYQYVLRISPSFREAQDRLAAMQSGKNLMFLQSPESPVRK
jgi:tetratricopeptide (TPR) repeat protein